MAWHQLVSEKWIDGTWKQKPFLILKIAYAKKNEEILIVMQSQNV